MFLGLGEQEGTGVSPLPIPILPQEKAGSHQEHSAPPPSPLRSSRVDIVWWVVARREQSEL